MFLEAARTVFGERGFAEASVAEVVERAGASVGSLYHHFGGKSELFLAVWDDHRLAQQEVAARAVSAARRAGRIDPFDLFLVGSRAFLEATWPSRDLIAMFMDGDTPPGFHHVQRQSTRNWIEKNFRLLRAENLPVNRVIVYLLTTFTGEARREIAAAKNAHEAQELVDAMIGILSRMRSILTAETGPDDLPNPV